LAHRQFEEEIAFFVYFVQRISVRFRDDAMDFRFKTILAFTLSAIVCTACSHFNPGKSERIPASNPAGSSCDGLVRIFLKGGLVNQNEEGLIEFLGKHSVSRFEFFDELIRKIHESPRKNAVIQKFVNILNRFLTAGATSTTEIKEWIKKSRLSNIVFKTNASGKAEVVWKKTPLPQAKLQEISGLFLEKKRIFTWQNVNELVTALESGDFAYDEKTAELFIENFLMASRAVIQNESAEDLNRLTSFIRYLAVQDERDFLTGIKSMTDIFSSGTDFSSNVVRDFDEMYRQVAKVRQQHYEKSVAKMREKGYSGTRLDKKARSDAAAYSRRYEMARACCSSRRQSSIKKAAKNYYIKSVILLGVGGSGAVFAASNWDDSFTMDWFKSLGREMTLALGLTALKTKIIQGHGSTLTKITQGVLAKEAVGLGNAKVLSALTGLPEATAEEKFKRLSKASWYVRAKEEIERIIGTREFQDEYNKNFDELNSAFTEEDDAPGLKERFTEAYDKVLDSIVQTKAFDGTHTWVETALDPVTYEISWLASGISKTLVISPFALKLLCMNMQTPILATAEVTALLALDQTLSSYLYVKSTSGPKTEG
jgi:hypothetical protein